jgi:serine protease Do
MSHHSRNWFKFVTLVVMAFALGLFFAGLLDFPRSSLAQDAAAPGRGGAPIVQVSAPRIPSARPLVELSEAFAAVAEAVRPTVVYVQAQRPRGAGDRQVIPPGLEPFFGPRDGGGPMEMSSGSGFIVSADGYILTNHHVIEGATEVDVRLLDGRTFDARVVGSDKDTDVGVLKIEAEELTPAALGSSADVRVGEWVLAIGNPLGADLTFSVTQGIVSAKGRASLDLNQENREGEIQDFIQTDAAINRGNSGGPLVNVRGEVVGINSAIASFTGFYAGYAFAVPIDLARAVMNQLIAHGRVQRTALGVYVGPVTQEDAIYLGLRAIEGVRVDNFVDDNSPARRAGLQPGDVIVAIDGKPVTYVAQLQQMVGFRSPGEEVEVEVARAGGNRRIRARVTSVGGEEPPTIAATPTDRSAEAAHPAANNPLGAVVQPLTPAIARDMAITGTLRGLIVRDVAPTSPAAAHLCALDQQPACSPDVITAIEGKPMRTEADLAKALEEGGRNGVVTLEVINRASGGRTRIERIRIDR